MTRKNSKTWDSPTTTGLDSCGSSRGRSGAEGVCRVPTFDSSFPSRRKGIVSKGLKLLSQLSKLRRRYGVELHDGEGFSGDTSGAKDRPIADAARACRGSF